jgi:glycosyltransferase involved in cell wall biosynthesis
MALRIALTSVHSWPAVQRGAERYVHELSQALRAVGHEVTVVSTGRPARSDTLGVPVRRYPVGRGSRRAREGLFGLQALASVGVGRVDVWHATSTGDGAAAALAGRLRPRLRTVFTDHGFPVRASRARQGDERRHLSIVEGVDSYVCVSHAAGEWLQTDYGRKADIVPPGVDTASFTPGGSREPRPTVLYSGALDEARKGIRLLVEAVALMPGATLQLVGPGTPDLHGLATDHVQVLGLAARGELRDLYRRAWVTALPSTAEAFGMALTESLACGTPGVARRDGGGPAEILLDGCGVLCDGTAASLALALEAAMDTRDPERCRARAEDFDWQRRVVPDLERLYAV